ncbi:MAG TPA: hypothetical protein VLL56_06105 [Terriglobia bacterium]|nr:hypothetical protein [Terriglobia bacterium]
MRRLIIKLLLFFATIEGLGRIDLMVLICAMGVAIAAIICTDLLLDSVSLR